jgi:hypothetical protein
MEKIKFDLFHNKQQKQINEKLKEKHIMFNTFV